MNIFLATFRYGRELGSEAIRLLAYQHIRDLRLRTGGPLASGVTATMSRPILSQARRTRLRSRVDFMPTPSF
jgi:hypothetical protein